MTLIQKGYCIKRHIWKFAKVILEIILLIFEVLRQISDLW